MTFYRVSPTGDDGNSGFMDDPWQTLGKLADVFTNDNLLVGGDIIVIDPGVTHDSSGVPLLFYGNDFASKVKIIMGGGGLGDKPEITGADTDVGVTLSNVTNLQISDWIIRNAVDGLTTNLVTDILIHGFEIKDIIGVGVGFSYYDQDLDKGRDFIFEHSYVHDTTGDGATSISAIRTQVRYCHFKNHGIGQASNLVDGVAFHGVKKDFCEVHHCIIENVEGKSGIGANFNGTLVEYNHGTYPALSCDIDAGAQTIEKTHGPAWSDGFAVGDYFQVTDSENPENDGIYLIAEILSTHKVRVSTDAPWATETQYTPGFTTTNHADGTANLKRLDGSRVYSHHNYLRNVVGAGINALEPLTVVISQNNIIVTPSRRFGIPFPAASLVFSSGANTIRIVGEDWTTRFSVGDLVEVATDPASAGDGLYKIASFSSNPDPNDTMLIVTTAPGVRDPAYDTNISVNGAKTGDIAYATPFDLGVAGFLSISGQLIARSNTLYNMSESEDPASYFHAVSSVAMSGAQGNAGAGSFHNNISVCTTPGGVHIVYLPISLAPEDQLSEFDYNCYWPNTDDGSGHRFSFDIGGGYVRQAYETLWGTFTDLNSVIADPLLIGDPSVDPRFAALRADSPCIGTGEDLSGSSVRPFSDDYRGRPRPDGAWDIGAMQTGMGEYPAIRTNRTGARMEFQITDSGCVGLRFSVTFQSGAGTASAGVILYRVMKPADYASDPTWQKAEITDGVVVLSRMMDPASTYIVEALVGRVATRVSGRTEITNVERFREVGDGDPDFGPSGMFVEVSAIVADVDADIRPVDWSALVADPFNVLLIGTQPEDGVVSGPNGERLDDGIQNHFVSLACDAVAQAMTTPRRLNLLTTAYDDQRMYDLQFPHLFTDGTTVASLANYRAGVGSLSTGEIVARAEHQDDPGSAGALLGMLTLTRDYNPDPNLVVISLGSADAVEYDPTDATWETGATAAMVSVIVQAMSAYDHMPRVIVTLPPFSGPTGPSGTDVIRSVIEAAVTEVRTTYNVLTTDVALVDLALEAAAGSQDLGSWGAVLTRDQHAWLARSGGAFRTAVETAFSHVL